MRILVLTGWYPNGSNKIKGVFVREQVRALRKSGLDVVVLYPFDEEVPAGELKDSWEEGIRVYRANSLAPRNRYLARIKSYWTTLRYLSQLDKEFQADILHVHVGYPAAIIAYFFSISQRFGGRECPYIITEHMSYLQEYVAKPQHRLLLKPAFEHAALVLPVSAPLKETIRGFGWEINFRVVPNVVDIERFLPGKARPVPGTGSGNSGETNILFVGGLDGTEIKGLQFLLPAFSSLLKEAPAHLHIIGDGVMRASYKARARELGIEDACAFYGWVSPQEMPVHYGNCDFLVLPSLLETFGCVLIEAMACGKPVLATACGGPQGIVREGTGLLVAPGNVAALEKGLREMVRDYSRFDPQYLREYAVSTYGPEALAGNLRGIYQTVLKEKESEFRSQESE